ncbi:MAG: glutamine amidotransferase [Planctomycetota bacterium]
MTNWSLHPILHSYWAVAFLAAGLILALWVPPAFRDLGLARRRALLMLRALVVFVVILLMLRPTHVSTETKTKEAVLLLLFDQSLSMQLPNASGNHARWDAQSDTLREITPLLRELQEDVEVKIHGYDTTLRQQLWREDRLPLPDAPSGTETDIGSSLHNAVEQEAGKQLAGVVLMGDGTQTAYNPDVETHEAARELNSRGFPLYTVSYGPPGDVAQSRDVAVENLPEQYTVFMKNELNVRGLIRIRGYVNKEIPVRLEIEDHEGKTETVGPVGVQADEDNQQVDVNLTYVPRSPGQYRLTLVAEKQSGELVTKNNRLTAFLTVLEGGLRVLYLEGALRQEQKFIRWALDSSPDIDLDFQWFPSRLRKNWPIGLGDTLESGNYDAFILGDLDSAALANETLEQLATEVERGKGLIALGGYHAFGPGGYRNTPLRDVLPIEMDRLARQDFDRPDVERWHVPGPLAMLPARSHPVTTLAPAAENEKKWRELRPLKGANRWDGVKSVPGVRILAESPDGVPLLVSGEYGSGRVLAFAGDSTWQWWRQGLSATHRRFWRQVVLWLAQRDNLTRNDVWIDMPRRRLPTGGQVSFTTGARTAMGDPIASARLEATLIHPDEQSSPLPLANKGEEHAGTVDELTEPGNYQIKAVATDDEGQRLGSCVTNFKVMDQDVELSNPAADPDHMARLANLTRESGGRVVAPEELPDVLETIRNNPPKPAEEVLARWQLADTPWDAWLVLGGLTALLTLEWFLRKRWALV